MWETPKEPRFRKAIQSNNASGNASEVLFGTGQTCGAFLESQELSGAIQLELREELPEEDCLCSCQI